MNKIISRPILHSEKGIATIEMLPLLVVFLILVGYSFGMYGIMQSAILNSIGARSYAFETFRNRANLTYFRSNYKPAAENQTVYNRIGNRLHTTVSENTSTRDGDRFPATTRPLAKGIDIVKTDENFSNASFHNTQLPSMYSTERYQRGSSPVWLRIGYGICLNSKCEP